MCLLRLLLAFIFTLFALALFSPKEALAQCKGKFTRVSDCIQACPNDGSQPGRVWYKTFSKYDCPTDSEIDPRTGERECSEDQALFNCSYPLWYSDSACQNQTSDNSCAATCSVNGSGDCSNGNPACKCPANAACVDKQYSAFEFCTGAFQQTTRGGCVATSCGFFCTSPSNNFCREAYAVELSPNQQNSYSRTGAQNLQQCTSTCFNDLGSCGEWCSRDVDISGRDCQGGLECISGVCKNARCPTTQNAQCQCSQASPSPPSGQCGASGQRCCTGGSCNSGLSCSNNVCSPGGGGVPPSGSDLGGSCPSIPVSCGVALDYWTLGCCSPSYPACPCFGKGCVPFCESPPPPYTTPPPPPEFCSIEFEPASPSLGVDESLAATVKITTQPFDAITSGIRIGPATATSTDNSVIEVTPQSPQPLACTATVTGGDVYTCPLTLEGEGAGSATLTVTVEYVYRDVFWPFGVRDPNDPRANGCSKSTTVTVTRTAAWWQSRDADIMATGDLRSQIPSGSYSFMESGAGGYPGIPAYSGTLNLGSGTVSANNWKANSGFTGRRWDYSYFTSLAPPEVFTDPKYALGSASVNVSELKNANKKHSDGYFWNWRNGDLTVNGTGDLGDDKVILLVNGNLTIGNNITLNDGKGFFGSIVKGNIDLAPQVSHPSNVSLEGLFMSDGQFRTGTGSGRLYLRGSVAAWGGIALQRDLGNSNKDTAAELIEYAPDMILTFPRELLRTGLVWREIAP